MLACVKAKAAGGDPEAIKTMEILRAIGFLEDEPDVKKELEVWEILDMCVEGSKLQRRNYWKQRSAEAVSKKALDAS